MPYPNVSLPGTMPHGVYITRIRYPDCCSTEIVGIPSRSFSVPILLTDKDYVSALLGTDLRQ